MINCLITQWSRCITIEIIIHVFFILILPMDIVLNYSFFQIPEKSMISIAWMRPFSFFISRLLKIYLSFFIPWKKFTVTQTGIFRRVVERSTGIGLFLLSKQQQRSTMFFFIKKNSIRLIPLRDQTVKKLFCVYFIIYGRIRIKFIKLFDSDSELIRILNFIDRRFES